MSTEWRSGLLLRIRAQYGLADLSPEAGSHPVLSPFSYGFQLGYLFGKKNKPARYKGDGEYLDRTIKR